ncbi:MAG: T9SS type A sorting domain-containing protein, partial [Ignavibacteriales bacterium]|nr:T9SS type A sorting domain-containing protein [Ignavibacteriales bacterium]
ANAITLALGFGKINAIAEPDIGMGSRLIGLRGISFAGGGVDITGPTIGRITGADVERDYTRGGIPYVVGGVEIQVALECDDPSITRFGGWHEVEDDRASSGQYCRNVSKKKGDPDAFLSFEFSGTGIDVHIAQGPRGGNAEVFIDGVSQGKIEFFREPSDPSKPDRSGKKDLTFGVVIPFSVSHGSHTFRLNVTNDVEGTKDMPRDIIYLDGFVIRGHSTGTASSTETSTPSSGDASPLGLVSQVLSATSNTTLLTGVVEQPDDADLDLKVLDPLGGVVTQSTLTNPTEAVRVVPLAVGLYTFQLINNSVSPTPYTFYQVVTTQTGSQSPSQLTNAASVREKPTVFELFQNYPNPFNPETIIRYDLPNDAFVSLKVLDLLGREVVSLVSGHRVAGKHAATFSASRLPSGVYFYRIDVTEQDGKSHSKILRTALVK